jgi:hypothetical protein
MHRNTLKKLIKEIVSQTVSAVQEMHDEHEILSDDMVEIRGIQLPTGQKINVAIGLIGSWADDGFAYDRGFDRGTHSTGTQFELNKQRVEAAYDAATEQEITLTPEIIDIALKEFAEIEDSVLDQLNSNPPSEDSYGGPSGNEYNPEDDM